MWIKIHYYQNTFTDLELSNFAIFVQRIYFKNFGKGKFIKAPVGFKIMTYTCSFVGDALTHCALLLEEKKLRISIVYFNRKYDTIWRCVPYHLKLLNNKYML